MFLWDCWPSPRWPCSAVNSTCTSTFRAGSGSRTHREPRAASGPRRASCSTARRYNANDFKNPGCIIKWTASREEMAVYRPDHNVLYILYCIALEPYVYVTLPDMECIMSKSIIATHILPDLFFFFFALAMCANLWSQFNSIWWRSPGLKTIPIQLWLLHVVLFVVGDKHNVVP